MIFVMNIIINFFFITVPDRCLLLDNVLILSILKRSFFYLDLIIIALFSNRSHILR